MPHNSTTSNTEYEYVHINDGAAHDDSSTAAAKRTTDIQHSRVLSKAVANGQKLGQDIPNKMKQWQR